MLSSVDFRGIMTAFGRLLRFRPTFADAFQATPTLAGRSFLVMAPAFILFIVGQLIAQDARPGVGPATVGLSLLATFLVNWLLLPLFIFCVGRFWHRRQEALNALYFYNCLGLAGNVVSLGLILVLTPLAQQLQSAVTLAWVLVIIVYEIYALRALLRIDGIWVLLMVAVDLGVGTLLQQKVAVEVLCIPVT